MIMRLFSVFDPTSYFGLKLNWSVMIVVFILIPINYYLIRRGFYLIFKSLFVGFKNVFNDVSIPHYAALNFLCVITFIYLSLTNLISLFPFVFTRTAHPLITLGLGLVFWISFFIIGWFKNFKIRAAHLVPMGSPLVLAPLIVLIERVRHLIRPFTLSIRLAANIIAGHLIVGLLSRIRMIRIFGFTSSLILQNILILLEFGVAIIQGFVFRILLLLYAIEYY